MAYLARNQTIYEKIPTITVGAFFKRTVNAELLFREDGCFQNTDQ